MLHLSQFQSGIITYSTAVSADEGLDLAPRSHALANPANLR